MKRDATSPRRATSTIGRWAILYFACSTVFLVAPVYTALGNHIEPRVFGLPWSLVYVLAVVLANATVLAVLHAARLVDDDDTTDAEPPP